jgi:hypothetical protein
MNIRPSTPQILRDLAEELNREIMPLLSDSTDQVRLHMIAAVLGQCAVRAGSEIALTKRETADYRDYAGEVVRATGHEGLRAALDAVPSSADLHLEVVLAEYAKASDAFALALEVAMDEGLSDLVARGEELLTTRVANEQLMAGVATAGR